VIFGEGGADKLYGDKATTSSWRRGVDILHGDGGSATAQTSATIISMAEMKRTTCTAGGDDILIGGKGDDFIYTGSGNDVILTRLGTARTP